MPTLAETQRAVREFFEDRTRPAGTTREGLEEIRDDIDTMIDALEADAQADQGEDG